MSRGLFFIQSATCSCFDSFVRSFIRSSACASTCASQLHSQIRQSARSFSHCTAGLVYAWIHTAVRRLFVRVLVRSFVPAVVRSFIPSFVRSLISLHICHFIRKSGRSPTNSFIPSIAGLVMRFLIQSVSGSFVRLFIRSFILPKMKDLRCRYQTWNDDTPITPEIRTSRHCF